jgi:hypothetical protein
MKRWTIGLLITMLYGAAHGLHAQQPPQKGESAHKTVQLIGCLTRTASDAAFTLTNARTVSRTKPEDVSPNAVGTAGATRAELAEYELRSATGVGESGVDAKELGRHLGHRVEVTARPIEQVSPPQSQPITAEQPKPRDSAAKIPMTVTAIKSLGRSCS